MITYSLTDKLTRLSDTIDTILPNPHTILIMSMTSDEYVWHFKDVPQYRIMHRTLNTIHYCKADIWGKYATGTFVLPRKEAPTRDKMAFSFYLSESMLLFIDDKGTVPSILKNLEDIPLTDTPSTLHFLFDFMEYLIKDDVYFLQHFEEKLSVLEEQLLDGDNTDFDRQILYVRKELAALGAYYEQLADMGESLQEALSVDEASRGNLLFGLYTDRVTRLYSNVQMLKEYSMQLREMHQTQIDVHQNKIMKFLTIVATLFMPLSLIAGWYGMNFINMPELASPYGYGIIILVSLLIIAIEIWLFHIKKWFD